MSPASRIAALFLLSLLSLLPVAACHRAPATPHGMTLGLATAQPRATLVWVGHGKAERFSAGTWHRVPAFDYEFSVEQKRYPDHWDSIKTMRRHHPDYDGSAGPRVQVYTFRLGLSATNTEATYSIVSSLGEGTGHGDLEFRNAVLDIRADVSRFAPFDRYRITQHYQYEAGRLTELVELSDGASPWVRNHEEAALFGPQTFASPPTTLSQRTRTTKER